MSEIMTREQVIEHDRSMLREGLRGNLPEVMAMTVGMRDSHLALLDAHDAALERIAALERTVGRTFQDFLAVEVRLAELGEGVSLAGCYAYNAKHVAARTPDAVVEGE